MKVFVSVAKFSCLVLDTPCHISGFVYPILTLKERKYSIRTTRVDAAGISIDRRKIFFFHLHGLQNLFLDYNALRENI